MSDGEDKKTAPGWYIDKRWPDEERRWDGSKWLDHWRPVATRSSPGVWIAIGFALTIGLGILTAIAFAVDENAGQLTLIGSSAIAGTVVTIGVLAKAVEVGIRSARR